MTTKDTRTLVHTLDPGVTMTLEIGSWACGCRLLEDVGLYGLNERPLVAHFCPAGQVPAWRPAKLPRDSEQLAAVNARTHARKILAFRFDTPTTRGRGWFVEAGAFIGRRSILDTHGIPYVCAGGAMYVPGAIALFARWGSVTRVNEAGMVTSGDVLRRCVWDHAFRTAVKYIDGLYLAEKREPNDVFDPLFDLYQQRTP